MSLLCKCIRLNLMTEDKTDSGGAESTWAATDAKNATYTVELLAGEECGGVFASQESKLVLKMNGCGRLRIAATGGGSLRALKPSVLAYRAAPSSVDYFHLTGPGGGISGCGSGDLVAFTGESPVAVEVCCGHVIELWVIHLDNSYTPELTIEYTIEVIG